MILSAVLVVIIRIMEVKKNNELDEQEMLFAQEEIKVDSCLDTNEDTTDESEQSKDDQQK